jgi:hypothetical protein
MYVGAITTPIDSQVKTCKIMAEAKKPATPAACQTRAGGRRNAVKIIVAMVATKVAGTKKAQTLTQWVRENSAIACKLNTCKSNINPPDRVAKYYNSYHPRL